MSNTISIVGRLGRDSERKNIGQSTLLEFNVGENVGYGDRKVTNWWSCKLWGKRAEGQLMDYLVKGASVVVFGEVTLRKHEDKMYPEINVTHVELVGQKSESKSQPQQQPTQNSYAPRQPAQDDSDELPF